MRGLSLPLMRERAGPSAPLDWTARKTLILLQAGDGL